MDNDLYEQNDFLITKRKFGLADIILPFVAVLFGLFLIKTIFVPLILLVWLVYESYKIWVRCNDKNSFMKITKEGISCCDSCAHNDFSYNWKEVTCVEVKTIRATSFCSFDLVVETKDTFHFFCIDSFDITPVKLEEYLRQSVPDRLLNTI